MLTRVELSNTVPMNTSPIVLKRVLYYIVVRYYSIQSCNVNLPLTTKVSPHDAIAR